MKRGILNFVLVVSFLVSAAQSPESREHYLDEVKYYTQKIGSEPGNISNVYLRATFYQVLTDFHASNQDFRKVLELYTQNPSKKYAKVATDACYFLADDYYFRQSDRTSAQSYINWGLSITPGDKRFEVLQTGIIGTYPEKTIEAQKRFESLIAKYPDDEKLIVYYAKFLERNNLEKSIKYYERAATINPYNIRALFALGSYYTNEASRVYKTTGDARKGMDLNRKSLAYFERIHQLSPDDKEIIEILVQCYGNMGLEAEMKKMERKLSQ